MILNLNKKTNFTKKESKSWLKTALILYAIFFFEKSTAQIFDDFSDGNFLQNPTWVGDVGLFQVNTAKQLQLNATSAGNAQLAVQGIIPDSAVWDFDFRMAFAPSASNFGRIFLWANGADLSTCDGYFLQLGENGAADALELYRRTAGQTFLLGRGINGVVATNPNIHIKVTRETSGDWTVAMGNLGQVPVFQFLANDATYFSGDAPAWFGIAYNYTVSNSKAYYFDNFSLIANTPDISPPVLLSASALDSNRVEVFFDEAIDGVAAQASPQFFSVNGGIGSATNVVLDASNPARVVVTFGVPFQSGQTYALSVSSIPDLLGNVQQNAQTSIFLFIFVEKPLTFDLLINEIMPDPSPSVGLPEHEFIELYNRSNRYVQLSDLQLRDATGTLQPLPARLFSPKEYVVLIPTGAVAAFPASVPTLVWAGFPSLNNDSDELVLAYKDGTEVDRISYNLNWYGNSSKSDGGWSLERVNPNLPCLGAANWSAAKNLPGGTPGAPNSVLETTLDNTAPVLESVFPLESDVLRLVFSEGLHESVLSQPDAFLLTPSLSVDEVAFEAGNRSVVLLFLSEMLQSGTTYWLDVESLQVRDCAGIPASFNSLRVGLAEPPEKGDIVINEVLFSPPTGRSRYLEIYNRSKKIVSLSDIFIAQLTDVQLKTFPVTAKSLLFPEEYAVFSPKPEEIGQNYSDVTESMIFTQNLPTWDSKTDNVSIYVAQNSQFEVVDSFTYRSSMHSSLLSESQKQGVSLERVRADSPTTDANNWTSAASPKYGSPSRRNSAFRPADSTQTTEDIVLLPLQRFSPDGDGREDFFEIQYRTPGTGFAAAITIFDSGGLAIKNLVRQELTGTEGFLRWDGERNDGSKATPGIYVLFVEIFYPNGTVLREKRSFALL